MCVHVPTKTSVALDRGCVYRMCVYVGTVRSGFSNALSIPCTQSAPRDINNNQFTGSVEALGKLTGLGTLKGKGTLCVGA